MGTPFWIANVFILKKLWDKLNGAGFSGQITLPRIQPDQRDKR